MKINRQVLEHLIETNSEGYALLHYQYTQMETEFNQLKHEYQRTKQELEYAKLTEVPEEVRVEQGAKDEELNRLTQALIDAEEEKSRLGKNLLNALERGKGQAEYIEALEDKVAELKAESTERLVELRKVKDREYTLREKLADLEHSYAVT